MAKNLSKIGINTSQSIEAWHVSQSVDALTGIDAYDITISGSLTVNGPTNLNGLITGTTFTGSFTGDGAGLYNLPISGTFDTSSLVSQTEFNNFTASYNTGSFTGSFVGDGSGLTGVTSDWDGTYTGDAEITGSLTIQSDNSDPYMIINHTSISTSSSLQFNAATTSPSNYASSMLLAVNQTVFSSPLFTFLGYTKINDDLLVTGSLGFSGSLSTSTTRISSSTYTVQLTDYRIGVKYSLTGSCNIQLPLVSSVPGQEIKFKDEEGNALTNNIHILASGSDVIDGASTASIQGDYHGFSLYNDGINKWFVE